MLNKWFRNCGCALLPCSLTSCAYIWAGVHMYECMFWWLLDFDSKPVIWLSFLLLFSMTSELHNVIPKLDFWGFICSMLGSRILALFWSLSCLINFFSVFLFFFLFFWGNRYGCLAIRCLSFLLFVYLSWDLWTQLYI
jgi:hypothetical protein